MKNNFAIFWVLLHNSFSLLNQLLILVNFRSRLIRNMNFSQVFCKGRTCKNPVKSRFLIGFAPKLKLIVDLVNSTNYSTTPICCDFGLD